MEIRTPLSWLQTVGGRRTRSLAPSSLKASLSYSGTIEHVWWQVVCKDALTINQKFDTSGAAQGAEDKSVQHKGGGTASIQDFYVDDFGNLYRSCGNYKTMYERHITDDGVKARRVRPDSNQL